MNSIQHHELIDYLADELSPERHTAVKEAIERDPELASELALLREMRDAIAEVPDPVPSAETDRRFAELLTTHTRAPKLNGTVRPLPARSREGSLLRPAALLSIAASMLLLVFGLGWYFGRGTTGELEQQLASTRTLMLELMNAEHSTTRMRAATVSLELSVADPVVIHHLGRMLRTDEKTSVRLAALDALARFSATRAARDEMLDAMAGDPPPAVRVQLLETLVALNEKRVLPYLEEIINNDSIPRPLRDAAQLGTFKLI